MSSKKKTFLLRRWFHLESRQLCLYLLVFFTNARWMWRVPHPKKYVTTFNMYWFVLRKYQSRKRNFHLRIALTQQNPKVLVHNYSNSKKILKTTTNLSLINEIDFELTTNPAGCCYWKFLVVISSTGCRSKTYQR